MLLSVFQYLHRRLREIFKAFGDLRDAYVLKGHAEARLIYAHGPRVGQVYRRIKGRNVVTKWLSVNGAAPTSGRDLMRRILVPSTVSGSLSNDPNAVIKSVQLGSGVTAETSSDTALAAPIVGSLKDFTSVEFDAINPYVTFIVEYDEAEVNQTISEAALVSGRTPADFIARKTFGQFSKTSDYILQIRWTIRI